MDMFNVNNPKANQILAYSEIERKFVNIDLTTNNGNIESGVNLSDGYKIFNNIVNGTMRFKTITSSKNIIIKDNGNSLDIQFDGNATTIDGKRIDDLLLKSNNLSDVNALTARSNISVYSKEESDKNYVSLSSSTMPNRDNYYSIGSNGRRYSDIYATAFHGKATSSIHADNIARLGAKHNDRLVFDENTGQWTPKPKDDINIRDIHDIDLSEAKNGSILIFNETKKRWEAVDSSYINSNNDAGTLVDVENVGAGLNVFSTRIGSIFQFRTLTGGNSVNLSYNYNNEEIIIDADVPQTTDDLPEGTTNRYYTNNRVHAAVRNTNITALNDMPRGINPSNNQGIVWNGTGWEYRNIAIDISSTDNLPEGSINRYYTDNRVYNAIESYIQNTNQGISLNQIKDVNVNTNKDTYLHFNGTNWVNKKLTFSSLHDASINGITSGQTIIYRNSKFVPATLPTALETLNESSNSLHFNQNSFDNLLSEKTTDDIVESTDRLYLTSSNLSSMMGNISLSSLLDVNIQNIGNGNILVWNGDSFIPADSSDLNVSVSMSMFELNNVTSTQANARNGQYLSWNSSNNSFVLTNPISNLSQLNGISIARLQQNDTLVYNGNGFVNKPALPFSKSGNYIEEQIIAYSNGSFRNIKLSEINIDMSINKFNDVKFDINSILENQTLIWDSSQEMFVAGNVPIDMSMGQLNNVDDSGIVSNQALVYDGLNYLPKNVLTPTISNIQNNHVIFYNGNDYINRNIFDILQIENDNKNDKDVLIYNRNKNLMEYRSLNLNDIFDLNFDYNQLNNTSYQLRWNNINQEFTLVESQSTLSINDLTNVIINNQLSNNQSLVWDQNSNNGNGAFVNTDIFLDKTFTNPTLVNATFSDGIVLNEPVIDSGTIQNTKINTQRYRCSNNDDPVFDPNISSHYTFNFTENTTISFGSTNTTDIYYITLILTNGDNFNISWPQNMQWVGGNQPTLTKKDIIRVFTYDQGNTWIGEYIGNIS